MAAAAAVPALRAPALGGRGIRRGGNGLPAAGRRNRSATSLTRCGAQSFIVMNIETRDSYFLYHAWTDALLCLRLAMSAPEGD